MADLSNKTERGVNAASALADLNLSCADSTRLITSGALGWKAVSLESLDAAPGERIETASNVHLAALMIDPWRGEAAVSRGRFVPYSLLPGAITLFPAGLIPARRSPATTRYIVCALDPAFVKEATEESDSPVVTEFQLVMDLRDLPLRGIISLLAAEAESGGLSGRLYADHLAYALALRFLSLSGGTRAIRPSQPGKLPIRALQRVLDRMRADLATDLDLNTLAVESGYSRSHFLRAFRAGMGCSPHQWLTRLRVEQAKTMLRVHSASLIDVALACGFASHAHFSKTFREIVGVTPSEYRRSHSPIR